MQNQSAIRIAHPQLKTHKVTTLPVVTFSISLSLSSSLLVGRRHWLPHQNDCQIYHRRRSRSSCAAGCIESPRACPPPHLPSRVESDVKCDVSSAIGPVLSKLWSPKNMIKQPSQVQCITPLFHSSVLPALWRLAKRSRSRWFLRSACRQRLSYTAIDYDYGLRSVGRSMDSFCAALAASTGARRR